MPDYSQGKIYMITGGGLTYFGSTTKKYLSQPLSRHRYKYYNNLRPSTSKYVIAFSDCKIELVEEYPCSNRRELELRERWWIENHECVNIQIPAQTPEEKYQKLQECKKRYRNSPEGKAKQREYNLKYKTKQKLINIPEVIQHNNNVN